MKSHEYATVIPVFTSMMWLNIGNKKDVISMLYSFEEKKVELKYYKNGLSRNRSDAFQQHYDRPGELFEEILGMLDLFVSRHKRLGNPNGNT